MSRLVNQHYKSENIIKELSDKLLPYFNKDLVIVNIGTDRNIGDSFAPMLGTFLKQSNFTFPVYGTIKEPVHALNISKRMNEIHIKHPNAFIIGIDACIGDDEDIGNIMLRDTCVKPGKGVGKSLPQVGDISIISIISSDSNLFDRDNIRLDFIMDLANVVKDAFIETEKQYYINNREIAVSNL